MSSSKSKISTHCVPIISTSYELRLSSGAAKLLMGMFQNPLHKDETPEVRELRGSIWTSLQNAGVTTDG